MILLTMVSNLSAMLLNSHVCGYHPPIIHPYLVLSLIGIMSAKYPFPGTMQLFKYNRFVHAASGKSSNLIAFVATNYQCCMVIHFVFYPTAMNCYPAPDIFCDGQTFDGKTVGYTKSIPCNKR